MQHNGITIVELKDNSNDVIEYSVMINGIRRTFSSLKSAKEAIDSYVFEEDKKQKQKSSIRRSR